MTNPLCQIHDDIINFKIINNTKIKIKKEKKIIFHKENNRKLNLKSLNILQKKKKKNYKD